MIKCIRLYEAFLVLDVKEWFRQIKTMRRRTRERKCLEDPEYAQDQNLDHTNIVFLLKLKYGLKIFKLFFMILLIVYFIGLAYFIWCDLSFDWWYSGNSDDAFLTNFEFVKLDSSISTLKIGYWALTSLSTVGLGDLHPRSDSERVVVGFLLLFGVAIFSYIMGNFVEIVDSYGTLTNELEDGERLSKFFGLLTQFNRGVTLNQKFKEDIERYFDYMWENNRNWAVIEEEDQMILEQLPTECIVSIFKDFLFVQFLQTFRKSFIFTNYTSKHSHAFFNWDHAFY